MKKIFIIIAAVIFSGASAQNTGELLLLSQNNFGISTARSAAMGGAFTSLGADASSMSINPAGLGMYMQGEISVSPQFRFGKTTTEFDPGGSNPLMYKDQTKTNKMVIGNIGAIYVDGNFTAGFGYNRLADFYSRSLSFGDAQKWSITDMFAAQLGGLKSGNLPQRYSEYGNYPPALWGAILGYNTGAVDNIGASETAYGSTLSPGSYVLPEMFTKTEGALDEFAVSLAYNYEDILYVGATIGIQSLNYNKFEYYAESADELDPNSLDTYFFDRSLYLTGSGVNFKIGAIVRPVDWFRIGVSFHSPTWMTVNERWDATSTAIFYEDEKDYYTDTPFFEYDYQVRTAARLLGGISATIANRAIISFDYKRTWDDKMKFRHTINEFDHVPNYTATAVDNFSAIDAAMTVVNREGYIDLNKIITKSYRPTNNYSAGLEANVVSGIYLRAGYMYQDSPYSDSSLSDYGTISQISAGFGYRTKNLSLDLAYVNSSTKHLPMKFFSYDDGSGLEPLESAGYNMRSEIIQNIIMTIGFRF